MDEVGASMQAEGFWGVRFQVTPYLQCCNVR